MTSAPFELFRDWELTTLADAAARGGGDVQTGPFGSQLHASDYVSHGVPCVMPQNIGDNRISTEGIAHIREEDAQRLTKYRLRIGDIIYSRRGDVGRRSLVRLENDGWLCGTGCLRVRFGEGHVVPEYAAYYLGHPAIRQWIINHAVGATMPNLNTSILGAVPFVLPPMTEQRKIADVLGAFDDKIELDRRMNETLEAMAQAIFRDWFVDFGPTRRKLAGITDPVEIMGGLIQDASRAAELAALFPEALGDNGLPEGWTEVSLGHLAVQTTESVSPRDYAEEIFAHFSIPAYDEGKAPKLEKGASILSNKTIVPDGAVLLSKLNPEIERVWLVPRSSTHRQICSTEFLVYQPSPSANTSYLYCLFREPSFREMLKGMATGTSKSHQRVSPKSLAQRNVTFSGSEIITAFGQIVDDLLRRTLHNREEQRTLAAIRDLLLPKLISGEIRLRDAEKIAEAAQ